MTAFKMILCIMLLRFYSSAIVNFSFQRKYLNLTDIKSVEQITNDVIAVITKNQSLFLCNLSSSFSCKFLRKENKEFHVSKTSLGNFVSVNKDFVEYWDPNSSKVYDSFFSFGEEITSVISLEDERFVMGTKLTNQDKFELNLIEYKYNIDFYDSISGHNHGVTSIVELKNGMLASGSWDNTVKIWDSNNNYSLVTTLDKHSRRVSCLLQLDNGMLVSGGFDKKIIVWNLNDRYSIAANLEGHNDWISSLLQLENGMLVSGSADKTIKIWNPNNSYSLVTTLSEHSGEICSLLQLKNGYLLSGSADNTIKIWNPNSYIKKFSFVYSINGHLDAVRSLIELDNGMLVSGSSDNTIKIWNPNKNFGLVTTLTGHTDKVSHLLQLKNGMLLSASNDTTVKLWNPDKNYSLVATITEHANIIFSLIQLKNGKLVSGSIDRFIKIWEISKRPIKTTLATNLTQKIAKLEKIDEHILASSSSDRLCLYEFSKLRLTLRNTNCLDSLKDITDFVKLNESTIITVSQKLFIQLWDINNLQPLFTQSITSLLNLKEETEEILIKKIKLLNQGRLILILNNNKIFVINIHDMKVIYEHDSHDDILDVITFDKNKFSTLFKNGFLNLYEFKPILYLNNRSFNEALNFGNLVIPDVSLNDKNVLITQIPKCLKLYDEINEILQDDVISIKQNLKYELTNIPCTDYDTLRFNTFLNQDKIKYEIKISPRDPPSYKISNLPEKIGKVDLFKLAPLDNSIKSIKFIYVEHGEIKYKENNENKSLELNKEYDARLGFHHEMGKDNYKNLDCNITFILIDIYGISSDPITLTIKVDLFKLVPLDSSIKSIKFIDVEHGEIKFKENNQNKYIELNREYDAHLEFVYDMDKDNNNISDSVVTFVLTDFHGIASDPINFTIKSNSVITPWYKDWHNILWILLIIIVLSYIIFCLIIITKYKHMIGKRIFISCCYIRKSNAKRRRIGFIRSTFEKTD